MVKEISNNIDLLKEIKDVFLSNNRDANCISVCDVAVFLMETYYTNRSIKSSCERAIASSFKELYKISSNISCDKLIINISNDLIQKDLVFDISLDDVKSTDNNSFSNKLLNDCYDELLKLYNILNINDKNNLDNSFIVSSVNSNFLISFGLEESYIFAKYGNSDEIAFSLSYKKNRSFDTYIKGKDGYNIHDILYEREHDLLKKIMVEIDDLPEWMRSSLYEKRKKQLSKDYIQNGFIKVR